MLGTAGAEPLVAQPATPVASAAAEPMAAVAAQPADPHAAAALEGLYARAYPQLAERLSPGRLAHTLSVVDTAEALAAAYGLDVQAARLAALLHDWDKDRPLAELVAAAEGHGLALGEGSGPLLHAFTGAREVSAAYPGLPAEVSQAVERHTLGAPGMSDLDMVVYVADLIEPLRGHAGLERLRAEAGRRPLPLLFRDALEATFGYLRSKGRRIHPLSLAAYDDVTARIQALGLAAPDAASQPPKTGGAVKTSRELALLAAAAADEKKATDIIIQEVRETMLICDYFVIATGANNRQVDAICVGIEERLRLAGGAKPFGREGLGELEWVLLDYGDVVVHVFQPELRDFYRLETLWNDSPLVDLAEAGIEAPPASERLAKLLAGQPGEQDGPDPTPQA